VTDTATDRLGLGPLEAVVAVLPVGVAVVDAAGTVCYLNPAGELLLGLQAVEVVGRPVAGVLPGAVGLLGLLADADADADAGASPVSSEGRLTPAGDVLTVTAVTAGNLLQVTFHPVDAPFPAVATAAAGLVGDGERDRLAYLARVTDTMIGTLHTGEASTRLAELVVPRLGDWAVVTVTGDRGGPGEEGRAHRDPARRADVDVYRDGRRPVTTSTTPIATALRTGRPVQLESLEALQVAGTLPTEQVRAAWRRLNTTSATVVPLRARGETFGALAIMRSGIRPPLTPAEVALAVEVSRRGALALDNARLYGRQLDVAETLQRSLLTPPAVDPDGLQIAVRYLPAASHQAVGGDWFDSFVLPGGGLALVIGDVVGHNVAATAAMSQIRSMLRAVACDRPGSPADVLGRLDRVLTDLGVDKLATALLARVEPPDGQRSRTLCWSSAGHVPPLLLRPHGRVTVLATPPQRLLGTGWTGRRTDHQRRLAPGDTVLLATDGLLEHGRCDLDTGMARLTAVLGRLAGAPVEELCDRLVSDIVTGTADDDIALLALHHHG
jgi:serine phosphatase RsbU (regulator of sigma subunit)